MERTSKSCEEIQVAALEYLTPNSIRKVVRRPKTDAELRELQVPFDGGTISVRLWGEGDFVLLVHGWAANQTDMFTFVPALVERGLCAVALDLPAHGESTGERISLAALGKGVLAVGKELGPLRGLIAHSVGGAASQIALANGLDVQKAVMLASPQDYELEIRQFAKFKGFDDTETESMLDTLRHMGVDVSIRSANYVPDIKIPGLIIHSIDDPVVPAFTAADINRYWKNSRLLEVDGLKHRGVLKDSFVIAESIDFLLN